MDFAFLPPEINSARMYTGPGPSSMLAAAGNWDALATELTSAAEGYGSVISSLTSMHWWGPASASMVATANPFMDWLGSTAEQTKQTANQARAAAAAFEQAYAMTVPPAVVSANRTQLKSLIASNIFGQNTAAIAATEAEYTEIWAQDAAAMYGYASTAAAARRLTPFSSPQQSPNQAGPTAQSYAVSRAVGSAAGAAQKTLSQLGSSALQVPQNWPGILPADFTVLDAILGVYATVGVTQDIESVSAGIISSESSLGLLDTTTTAAQLAPAGLGSALSAAKVGGAAGPGLPGAATASIGRAGSIGQLSIPASWAAPSTGPATPLSGSGLTTIPGTDVPDQGMPGAPGMPVGSVKRASSVVPRYGVRLTVMPRSPAAG